LVKDVVFSDRYQRNFKKLSTDNKQVAGEKLKLFLEDPFHPSFRTKKIQGAPGMWESSINMDVRMTWRWGAEEGVVELSNIGSHDKTLKHP
jgi:mRNA-degrading endonuclease YafQ of YafQ-DinJ toxin-antitoxin module